MIPARAITEKKLLLEPRPVKSLRRKSYPTQFAADTDAQAPALAALYNRHPEATQNLLADHGNVALLPILQLAHVAPEPLLRLRRQVLDDAVVRPPRPPRLLGGEAVLLERLRRLASCCRPRRRARRGGRVAVQGGLDDVALPLVRVVDVHVPGPVGLILRWPMRRPDLAAQPGDPPMRLVD